MENNKEDLGQDTMSYENMDIVNKGTIICNHNLNDKNNTLMISKKRRMVVPNTINCICYICKECFSFKK